MNFTDIISIIGSIASIISIIGALISWKKANKVKQYINLYHANDTKEKLHTVSIMLETIQEASYKLNSNNKRGINKDNELSEYSNIRQKLDTLIKITPSKYSTILTKLNSIKDIIDSPIQKSIIIDIYELTSLKNSIKSCIEEVKLELENIREDLVELQK